MGITKAIVEVIMKQMPQHAEHYVSETEFSGASLSVHWKLKNDPDRPNKYSKTIVIHLTPELLEDFPNYPDSMQKAGLRKIESDIRAQLNAFDPDHTASRYQNPPRVEWTISSGDLFA